MNTCFDIWKRTLHYAVPTRNTTNTESGHHCAHLFLVDQAMCEHVGICTHCLLIYFGNFSLFYWCKKLTITIPVIGIEIRLEA